MKKLLSLLLAATFILSAVVFHVSAESAEAFTVSVDTVNATQAQSDIVVPVRLSGNPGISGFSFCVEYDTDNLVLVKSEITIGSGYKVMKETSGNGLNLAWTGTDTYTDNGTVANLYFNIVPDAAVGKADVRIKYRDGYDSFYKTVDGEEQDIAVVSSDGGVNISNIEAVSGLKLNVGNASAALNETNIVIPISVENNTGISGFSFCVNYDATRLNLENADIALSDGYKVTSKPDGYEVNLAWTSENGFANNGIIANLHFSVKENAVPGKGYINVLFRDSYDSFYKVVGGQETDIVCTVINGYIDVADHSYGDWIIVKEATCKETGLKRRICTDPDCGKTDEVIIPKAPHQYIETVVPATCEEQGFTKHTCSVCEDVFFDNYTDALPHSLGDWELSVAPDCTNSGEEVQKCTVCQAVINRRSIAALGHSYGEWTVFKEATFNEDGESRKYCSKCDAYKTQRIPKLSETHTHDYSGTEEIITPATCTAEGSKKVYCSETECGSYIIDTIPIIAHEYGEWQITTEATFDTDGEKTRQCKHCDAIETERIPMLSESHTHSFSGHEEITEDPTCTESGVKRIYCTESSCGEYITETISPLGHSESDWSVETAETCTENGVEVKKCTRCGTVLQTRIIEATGHSWNSGVVTKEPTCIEEGVRTFTCTKCNGNITKPIPATGHTPGEWEITQEATCTDNGTKVRHCTVCGDIVSEDIILATGHQFGEWIVTVQPTETTLGKKERTCSVCDFKEDQTIDPVGNIPKITVEDTSAKLDEEFTVNVVIEDNPGIIAMSLKIGYDSDVLELLSATVQDYSELSFGPISANPFVVSWEDVLSGNNSTSGTFVQLTFKVKSSVAVSSTQITVSYDDDNVFNADFDNVFFEIQSGEIGIIRYQPGDVNRDGKVNLKDYALLKQYINGWEIDIELSVADVTGDKKINLKDLALLKQYINGWDVVLK